MENTIHRVEKATREALRRRHRGPRLGGVAVSPGDLDALPVFSEEIGHVQLIEIEELQRIAERAQVSIEIASLPGCLVRPGRELAYVSAGGRAPPAVDLSAIAGAFRIGKERTFDDDPRFGMVVLSEIASRALSPGINDAGTAIQVIASLVRILALRGEPSPEGERGAPVYDRIAVPELSLDAMFDDSFRAIARDGADRIEVVEHLLKALRSLTGCSDRDMPEVARRHARAVLARAEAALTAPADIGLARDLARFAHPD